MRNIDTSQELQLSRFGNGVKLKHPEDNFPCKLSIANLMELQFPIYFNTDHIIVTCNETSAELNGFISHKDSIGKKWTKPHKKNTVIQSLINEKDVITNKRFKIIEDIHVRKDDVNIHALSFKMPWYDDENKVIGLFGCSVILGKNPLAESLSQIAKLGFLNSDSYEAFNFLNKNNHPQLSKREQECLRLFLNGKTAKETANILGLSYRTIEEYFTNIKKKLGYRYKRDLLAFFNE